MHIFLFGVCWSSLFVFLSFFFSLSSLFFPFFCPTCLSLAGVWPVLALGSGRLAEPEWTAWAALLGLATTHWPFGFLVSWSFYDPLWSSSFLSLFLLELPPSLSLSLLRSLSSLLLGCPPREVSMTGQSPRFCLTTTTLPTHDVISRINSRILSYAAGAF